MKKREKSLIEDWDNYPCNEEFFCLKLEKKKFKIKRCNEKDHEIGPNFLMYMISSLQIQILSGLRYMAVVNK